MLKYATTARLRQRAFNKGRVRLDSELEIEYYRIGGVLNYVLDKISKKQ
jgi:hypothetical protein